MHLIDRLRNGTTGGGEESGRLSRIIHHQANALTREILDDILAEGADAKPTDWDKDASEVAQMFCGNQKDLTAARLRQRYPKSYKKFPVHTVNTIRQFAELDAQAYRESVDRWVEVRDGDGQWVRPGIKRDEAGTVVAEIEPDEVIRQEIMAELVEAAGLEVLCLDWERRTAASLVHFARIAPSAGRMESRLFWPDKVRVVMDPAAPGRLDLALRVAVVVSESRDADVWEVWSRVDLDDGGRRYIGQHINTDGEILKTIRWDHHDHPIFAMHAVDPQGGLWPDENRDAVEVNLNQNVLASTWLYLVSYQGAKQKYITGDSEKKGDQLIGGAGTVWRLKSGSTAGQFDANLTMIPLEGAEALNRLEANARRQNPDAVATKPGAPLSGVSRTIRNIASDQKRAENVLRFKAWEQTDFLARLYGIAVAGGIVRPGMLAGRPTRIRSKFPKAKDYEEPESRRLRYSNGMRDGLISPAEAAARSFPEVYPDKAAAVAAGVSEVPISMQTAAPESRARVPGSEPAPLVPEGVATGEGGEP